MTSLERQQGGRGGPCRRVTWEWDCEWLCQVVEAGVENRRGRLWTCSSTKPRSLDYVLETKGSLSRDLSSEVI